MASRFDVRQYSASRAVDDSLRPADVGIKAMEIYFPTRYVAQEELEKYDGVSAGKYTIGLGQNAMAFCGDREDINSVCMTAVHNLLEKYDIPYEAIGRLEVGTETMVDKSKAVKTSLMSLFAEHGNTDIEGIDSKNACYGGTAAVLNSLAWCESSAWDGRYALVVAGDIAVYEKGPARPTGGAGVVAMLIGPDAPLVAEPGLRHTYMEDVYDFYKPTMVSEYPRVDGHLSNECYIRAIDMCYRGYAEKFERRTGENFSLASSDYAVFHAPYNKLVQKSFGRYLWNDYLRAGKTGELESVFGEFKDISVADSYVDRGLLKAQVAASKEIYQRMVQPSELITKECGNSYCGSLYAGLLSLVSNKAEDLEGKRLLLFSYGSGLAATLFSLRVKGDVSFIRDTADVQSRLAARKAVEPALFEDVLTHREATYTKYDYEPQESLENLAKGTYYVKNIDHLERRQYSRTFHTAARAGMMMWRHQQQTMPKLASRRRPLPSTPSPPIGLRPGLQQTLTRALRLMRR